MEICPLVQGFMLKRRGTGMMAKLTKRFYQLISNQGVLIKFMDESHCKSVHEIKPDFYNLTKKEQEKLKIEVLRLVDIKGELQRSSRPEFQKKN